MCPGLGAKAVRPKFSFWRVAFSAIRQNMFVPSHRLNRPPKDSEPRLEQKILLPGLSSDSPGPISGTAQLVEPAAWDFSLDGPRLLAYLGRQSAGMNKSNCFSALSGLPGHFVLSSSRLSSKPQNQTPNAFCVSVYSMCSAVEDAWGALSRCSMLINNWHQCTRAREAVWYDMRLNLLG